MRNLKKIFETTFNISISEDSFVKLKVNDISEWDSMGNINFILTIEEAFDTKFSLEEIEEINSIEKIKIILKKKKINVKEI